MLRWFTLLTSKYGLFGTISEFLTQLHEKVVLFFDVQLLVGQTIVDNVVSDPVL